MVDRWIVDALTAIIVCAVSADSADQSLSRIEMPADWLSHCRTISRADIDWAEVANGTSIAFDLRIAALDEEAEADT